MPYTGSAYLCRCDCGNEKIVGGAVLRRGSSTSCGCYSTKTLVARSTTHGLHQHPLYRAWCRMKERCTYKKHVYYDRYGGRGIKICKRWKDFQSFYDDNIDRWKPGLTIDRIDNDGNYSPENCRWVSQAEQNRNRSNAVTMTLNGKTDKLVHWAKRLNLPQNALRCRRASGWTDHEALTTPYGQKRGSN